MHLFVFRVKSKKSYYAKTNFKETKKDLFPYVVYSYIFRLFYRACYLPEPIHQL